MKGIKLTAISLAVSAILTGVVVHGDEPGTVPSQRALSPIHRPAPRGRVQPVIPLPEPGVSTQPNGFASATSLTGTAPAATASGTTLTGPATLTYGGSSNALTVTDSGTGRGLSSTVTNVNSGSSALFGSTVGTGAGLTGYNSGTSGPGGKFAVTNANSAQAAVFATTNGTGNAVLATVTNTTDCGNANFCNAAIYGQSITEPDNYGLGVEGEGGRGVLGLGDGDLSTGVEGETSGKNSYGVYGIDNGPQNGPGYGVYAHSDYGTGLYAESGYSSEGLAGQFVGNVAITGALDVYSGTLTVDRPSGSAGANGASIHNPNGYGIYVASDNSTALLARSTNARGVDGEDLGNGVGVYGSSASGYAGYFVGTVAANTFQTLSDRNAKTHFAAIDGADVLERISHLPVTAWDFKTDLDKHHVGPMAQDFHAEFGLDGDDDKHINLADMAGVTLAAVQELNKQMREKDVQIADLKARLAATQASAAHAIAQTEALQEATERVAARMTALEQRQATPRVSLASVQ